MLEDSALVRKWGDSIRRSLSFDDGLDEECSMGGRRVDSAENSSLSGDGDGDR